ncbi:MAG: J domain-containing protein [Pirellulaceae bacterium]|nr:J domain-containing protein [Pirellulaceae bacterium]
MNSFYEILGVERSASRREIRDAFLNLAHQHHPDLNRNHSGADEQFKHVRRAYEVLSDPIRRAAYDDNPGLFPLAQEQTGNKSTIVPEAYQASGPNRFHSSSRRRHPETAIPFSFNLQPAQPKRKRLILATLCTGIVMASISYFALTQPPTSTPSAGHRLTGKTSGIHPSPHLSVPIVPQEDRYPPHHELGQAVQLPSGSSPRDKQLSASHRHDTETNAAQMPSSDRELHTHEFLFQLHPENSPFLLLPQDESHTVLIPDFGVTGSIIVPKAQVALLPDYVEQQRLLLNDLGSTFQQLIDTPLPEMREPAALIGPPTFERLPPLQMQLPPTAQGGSSSGVLMPGKGPLIRPGAELSGTPSTSLRLPRGFPGYRATQEAHIPSWSRPLSFSVVPPTSVAVPPTPAGLPISSGLQPGRPGATRYGPIENKHLPYQPFNPSRAQPEAKNHSAGRL